MSARALSWAWDQMPALNSSARKLVLLAMADRADDDGELFPKVAWIGEKTMMGRSTVRKHIAALEEAGLVQRDARHRQDGSQTTNLLRLSLTPRSEPSAHPLETEGRHAQQASAQETTTRDDHFNNKVIGDVEVLWEHFVVTCRPANVKLTASRSRVLARALNEAPLELCKDAVNGLDEYVRKTAKGKRDISRVFATRPGGSALADQIEWWASQSSSRQPNGDGRNLPPWVRAALIASRNHHTARWDVKSRLWVTDQQAINNAASEAVMYAAGRNLRVEWTGDDHRTLELREATT